MADIGGVAHTIVFSAPRQLASLVAGFADEVSAQPEGVRQGERTRAPR